MIIPIIAAQAQPEPPNLLLIVVDDAGYGDFGFMGSKQIRTPHLDQVAKDGVIFTNGYVTSPVCSPSRAALLTGRYAARFGPTYEDYFGGGSPELDPEKHPTIGQMMKDAGYRTACFGKWNVSNANRRRANDFGFETWVGLHLNHDYYTHKLQRTGEHDLQTKVKRAREFLEGGDKVLVCCLFRGRQMAHKEVGEQVINEVVKHLADIAKVEAPVRQEGRRMVLMLAKK